MAQEVVIRVVATGAEQAARVLAAVGREGGNLGSVVASGAKQANQATEGFRAHLTALSTAAQGAGLNTGILSQATAALASPLGLAGVATTALAVGIRAVTASMIANHAEVKNLMAVSGLSAEAADNLADTFQLLGKDSATLTNALFKMSSEIESGGENLLRLGISTRTSSGALKAEGNLFLEIRDRISQMGSASERSAALMMLFGRSGRELAAVFSLSREKFKEYQAEAAAVGQWTDKMQKQMDEFTIATNRLGLAWEALKQSMGPQVVTILTNLANAAERLLRIINDPGSEANKDSSLARFLQLVNAIGGQNTLRQYANELREAKAAQDALAESAERFNQDSLTASAERARIPMTATEIKHLDELQKRLDLMRGSEWDRPIRQLTQSLKEFAGPNATPDARKKAHELYGQLANFAELDMHTKSVQGINQAIIGLAEGLAAASKPESIAQLDQMVKALADSFKNLPPFVNANRQALMGWALDMAEATITAREMAKVTAEAWSFAAGTDQGETGALMSQAKLWSDLGLKVQEFRDAATESGDQIKFLEDSFKATAAALTAAQTEFGDTTDDVVLLTGRLEELGTEIERQKFLKALAEDQKRFGDVLTQSRESLDLFTSNLGKTREEVARNQAAFETFGTTFDKLHPTLQQTAEEIARIRIELSDKQAMQAFTDDLLLIGQTAQLIGRDFDLAAAMLDRVRARMLELAKVAQNDFSPEIQDALAKVKAEFDSLTEFTKTRDLFQDVFSSLQGGIEQMIRALQSGTRTWESFGQVVMDVLRSIALEIVNTLLKKALDPLMKELANLAAVAISGTPASLANATAGNGSTIADPLGEGSLNSFASNVQTAASLTNSASSFGSVMTGFSNLGANWAAGSLTGGFTGGVQAAMFGGPDVFAAAGSAFPSSTGGGLLSGFTGPASAFSTALAGVAAGLAVFDNILNLAAGNVESFAFRVGGAVVGGVAAGFLTGGSPMGILAGIAIGDFIGGLLADLFGIGPSDEWLKFGENLQGTLVKEQEALLGLQSAITGANNLEDLVKAKDQFVAAIEAAGVGGFAATVAGSGLFQIPGIPGATGTDHEGKLVADFGPAIQQINDVIDQLLAAFIDQITTEMPRAVEKLLPPALFDAFVANTIGQLKTEFEALTQSSTATVEDLQAFEAEMQAIAQQVIVFDQLGVQIAALSGDLGALTARAKLTAEIAMDQAAKAIEDSKSRLAEAISGPEIVAATQELQQALLAKYDLEKKLLADIEATIGGLLQGAGASWLQNIGVVIGHAISQGSTGPLGDLLSMMESIGQQATSTTLRLFAVQSALGAIIGAIPGLVSAGLVSSPSSLAQGVVSAAGPSLGTLGNMFAEAQAAGDLQGALAILGQGASMLQGLASAPIAGIRQGEQAQEQAARATHARLVADIGRNRDELIAKAGAIQDKLIADIQANSDAQIKGLEAQRVGIQKNLELSRQWAQVSESLARYLVELRLGSQAPPDPMGQFLLAQTLFDQSGAAFAAGATPEGAQKVQQSAADLLAAAQLVYTRPSPEYRALFEMVTAKLEAVQATAAAFVTPEEQAVEQLASIDQQIEDLRAKAQADIDAIRSLHDAFVAETQAAAQMQIDGLDAQLVGWLKGMHEEAQFTVDGINQGLASAMAFIAGEQQKILGALLGAQEDLAKSITGGRTATEFMALAARDTVNELFQLRAFLAGVIGGVPTDLTPPPSLIPSHASGAAWTRQGLAYLHEGEAVLNRRQADRYRTGAFVPVGAGAGVTVNVTINGATDTEKVKREVMGAVDQAMRTHYRDYYRDDR